MAKAKREHLSASQYGVYLESVSHPDSTLYNLPFLGRLGRDVEPERLVRAMEAVIAAHPALNTVLSVDGDGEVWQRVDDTPLEVVTSELSAAEFAARRAGLVRPFALTGGKLARFELYVTPEAVWLFEDMHHVIFDGTTAAILSDELRRAYEGETIAPEAYTLLDSVRDEEAWLASDGREGAKAYWDALLADCEAECLPERDNRSDTPEQGWLSREFTLDEARFAALRHEAPCSTSAFFTAVMGQLVSVYSGQEDVLFNTIYSGRSERTARTAGMFVRTLPVRVNAAIPRVRDFLSEVNRQLTESRAQSTYPYVRLAGEYGLKNEISFGYQKNVGENRLIDGWDIEVERLYDARHIEAAQLLCEVSPLGAGRWRLHLGYRKDRWSDGFAQSLAETYIQIARELLAKDTFRELTLLSADAAALLESVNATETQREDTDVVTLFRRQVRETPENVAVVYEDRSLTYAQLDELTERLACRVRAMGLGRGDVVSVLIPRGEYMAIASLGALKAGCAYQPLDPSYPEERLRFMMEDAEAKLLIADEALLDRVPAYAGAVLLTRDIPALPPCEPLADHPAPDDLFILLYTSGTTGTPKGVMLTHRNLAHYARWARDFFGVDAQSRQAAYASYGFDAHMHDLYSTLLSGAALYIIPDELRLDLEQLRDYFEKNGVTHGFMTTQVARQFYTQMDMPAAFRCLDSGGEALLPLAPKEGVAIYNSYGPTECTCGSTSKRVEQLDSVRIPIGRAVENAKVYVVDALGRRVPPGAPGELWIAGRGVAKGYLKRPEKTAEVFVRNPFTDAPDYARAYRTGDVVRFLPEGDLDFIGRRDGQVKIRGFRVELSEVEGVIREFPGITDATVTAFDAPSGGKFLAAYVVSDTPVDSASLQAFICARKPAYMAPAAVVRLDAIPLNQNGKVNRRALPKPELGAAGERKQPQSEAEKRVFDCAADAMGHSDFGVDTDLYFAGLSSISSIRLGVLLGKAFHTAVRSADLKAHPTVESLARFLAAAEGDTQAREAQETYPLSASQQGVFVDCIANNGTTIYNIPALFKLSGAIDLQRLQSSLEAVIEAHPYLKVRLFMDDDGEIRQRRRDDAPLRVTLTEGCDRDSLVRPFDVLGEPLARFSIHRADDGNYLFIDLHHLIADGMSLRVLLADLERAYRGETLERERYTAYEAALDGEDARKSVAYQEAKDFFDGIFADCGGGTDIPADRHEDAPRAARKSVADDTLSAASVRSLCERYGVTENVFFLGAFGAALARLCERDKAVFTTIYHGRNDSRLNETVGMLVKTLPVLCDTTLAPEAYFKALQQQLMGMMEHDVYPFSEISAAYGIAPNTMADYRGTAFAFDTICGKPATLIPLPLNAAKEPISFTIGCENGGFVYELEYRGDLYSEAAADKLLAAYAEAVRRLCAGGAPSLSAPPPDVGALPSWWDEPFVPVTRRFEAQAREHPERKAVVCQDRSLTYAALNEQSNRLAHALIEQGVNTEDIVAVMLPRSENVYIARQGILKSGGAFLCIAPDYPDDRVRFILEDSEAKLLITDEATLAARRAAWEGTACKAFPLEELLRNERTDDPDREPAEHDLCYCIYTSGSTGRPKGVMIEHGNLANFVSANPKNHETLGYTERGRVSLSLAAMTFDVSIMEEFIPLDNGLTAVIATEEEIHDLTMLSRTILANGVDIVSTTPSFVSVMLDVDAMREALRQVKVYDLGAEAFPAGLRERICEVNPDAYIMNGYGPTEATISCTMKVIDDSGAITIGVPNANVFTFIVDDALREVPQGETGELLICGKGVGRGYVKLPEKTAEAFVSFRGLRGYRSGDLACVNADGEIEFHGRKDNQVKLRGFRVELGEVEEVIASFPDVTAAVAVAVEDTWLCVYFTATRTILPEELTEFASRRLTEYMVPNVLMQLDKMPLTDNKKIDKKALPAPDLSAMRGAYAAPRTPEEEKLCALFAKALKTERVGIDDNFFTLGGTSLVASKLAVLCMGEKIPLVYADIFKLQTVRAICDSLYGGAHEEERPNEFADYDYGKINALLAANDSRALDALCYGGVGDILLTGATGFLGIHVLRAFLQHHEGKVFCLVRRGGFESPQRRLQHMLMYYFDDPCEALFGERILCIDGDITDAEKVAALKDVPFRTLINCAACVKHFSNDATLERINLEGVRNLVALCQASGRRLIQISTISSAGESVDGDPEPAHRFRECELYFGQHILNEYIRTKFLAEREVLAAAADGLDAKVIRLGNLMSRAADGEFQINFITNGFLRSLRGYQAVGAFPIGGIDEEVEFSPIDSTAEAVLKLAGTDRRFTVFHACNSHRIHMGDVIYAMRRYGFPLRIVEDDYFADEVKRYAAKHEGSDAVAGLIAYSSRDKGDIRLLDYDATFTTRALYRLGWKWPITDDAYLTNAIRALDGLEFFSDDYFEKG